MTSRLEKLRAQFQALKVDAFLVTFSPHLRYMSGFSGSNGIGLVTPHSHWLVTDGRYDIQAREEARGWKVIIAPQGLLEEMRKRKLLHAGTRVGFDGNTVIFSQVQQLRKMFPGVKFLPKADTIEKIAVVKDPAEIEKIKCAVAITDRVFTEILPLLKPGVPELDIAAEISYRQRKHGSQSDAFESIVASGVRSALPHGRATEKKLAHGDFVTLDFGCVYDGYMSDMTRTIVLGRATSEMKKIYQSVLGALTEATEAARSGMKTSALDSVARMHIKRHGYDKFFRHSLGHGIGLQIHEAPRISVLSKAHLEPGSVITIEPGIYVPHLGGVRIEDDVVIRDGRCEVLTGSPKELMIL